MKPEAMRYCSTGEVHLDFHGSTYVGLKYLLDHHGMDAVDEVLTNTAEKVYKSIDSRMKCGDSSELICFWGYYLKREKADFSLTEDGNGGAVLELRECPALRQLAKEHISDRGLICHATMKMNQIWCDGSPFEIIIEPLERGCRQILRRKGSA